MSVVKADILDLDSIFEINKQLDAGCSHSYWLTRKWIKEEIKEGNFFVIKEKNVYAAMCLHTTLEDEMESYINTLAVHNEQHSRGFGTQLVNFAIDYSQKKNKSLLTVESLTEMNVKKFYIKQGFKLGPEMGDYYGHPFYCFYMNI
tara:strand:+ start:53 stop:490 length:438 start_codon:yes stop_codon:yes gene_type:complete